MKKITTEGFICLKDNYNFVYKIAKIEYEEWIDGTYQYKFFPFYDVIDLLSPSLFQGIPGLDLSSRKEVYLRKNIVPTFISERTPSERREDVSFLMEENEMKSLNRLEWLIRSNKRYSGDRLYVIPVDGNDTNNLKKQSMYDLVKRSDNINKKLLDIICFKDNLYTDEVVIDDSTRLSYYRLLMSMYTREYEKRKSLRQLGIEAARERNVYKGREKIKIDPLLFEKIANDYKNGKITIDQATKILKISKSTFFRRLLEKQ